MNTLPTYSKTCLEAPDSVQLCLRGVSKVFTGKKDWISRLTKKKTADFVAIDQIDLDIEHNTFVSIIGPSGCGKSTLLNIIAGLSSASSGRIMMNGIYFNF